MGTKMPIAFANIYMVEIEQEILRLSIHKPLTRKKYIDHVFSPWGTGREEMDHFIEHVNSFHPAIKFESLSQI